MGSFTLVGLFILVVLVVACMRQRHDMAVESNVKSNIISKNDDFDDIDVTYKMCRKYVDGPYVEAMHSLLGKFLLAYEDTYRYDKCKQAILKMYRLRKALHRACFDVRYRLPQDGALLDKLTVANQNLAYATTVKIREAEKRCKLSLGYLPLDRHTFSRHFRAHDDRLDATVYSI